MTKDALLDHAQTLSLTARACIALHITEAYFKKIGLQHPLVDTFFNHLWDHPLQSDPKAFSTWEAQRGDLVDFGLTDDLPDDLEELMPTLPINEQELFHVVEAPVEILWGNFFSNPDDQEAMRYLHFSLDLAEREGLIFPDISLYQNSRYADNNGWGHPISENVRDSWRSNTNFV
ncbi:hypothetical protein ACFSW8_10780 [Rubritalea tangerina]|uniref:DUF4240 domain-containing protein n=2 Tax=Rubritalea tangerina TaxID=430798 RepID=A0ABW4ZCE1_9BACT